MNSLTIGEVTYTDDGIYVDGKLLFKNDVLYYDKPDYIKVIRCRDCKYFDHELGGSAICRERCWDNGYDYDYTEPNGYCFRGKRKLPTEETIKVSEEV